MKKLNLLFLLCGIFFISFFFKDVKAFMLKNENELVQIIQIAKQHSIMIHK